jgi:uncharacterized damage-inducible protein DinB
MMQNSFGQRACGIERNVAATELAGALDSFGSTRAQTLALVRDLSQSQMDYAPVTGKWSVGEVLDHLVLAERFFRGEITQLIALKRAGRKPVLQRSFKDLNIAIGFLPKSLLPFLEIPFTLFNPLVPRVVKEFLLRSRLIPAQHPDVAAPRNGRVAQDLRADLASSLQETLAVFEANADLDFSELIHQHPLLGSNNVLELMRILVLHEQRHQEQVADVLSSMERGRAVGPFGALTSSR